METVLYKGLDKIKLLIKLDEKIPSVNSIYQFNRKTGAVYRDPLANRVYQSIQSQITLSGISDFMPQFIKGREWFSTSYQFVLRYGMNTRDLSNMLKLVEDAIHRKLGIDDHCVNELRCVKSFMQNASHTEFIVFEIAPSNFDSYFFNR